MLICLCIAPLARNVISTAANESEGLQCHHILIQVLHVTQTRRVSKASVSWLCIFHDLGGSRFHGGAGWLQVSFCLPLLYHCTTCLLDRAFAFTIGVPQQILQASTVNHISIPVRISRLDKASLADNVHNLGGLVVNIPS